ncbi:protein-L-isoaspartate O-methyltransferase [soil metagenome]
MSDRPPFAFDVERARFNMIEQQIRPWDVLDETVLALLGEVKREEFVAPTLRELAFIDRELPLLVDGVDTGETMLTPKLEARIVQEILPKPTDTVLEIGAGSGYMAALLSRRTRHVTSVEVDPRLAALAEANLRRAGIDNVSVVTGNGAEGFQLGNRHPDIIVVSGSLPSVPPAILADVAIGGRIFCVTGTGIVMSGQLITRTDELGFDRETLFETWVKPLRDAVRPSKFSF